MTVALAPGLLVAFLLALVRSSAWVVISPPFNSRLISGKIKVGIATALAVSVAPSLAPATVASAGMLPVGTVAFIEAVAVQAFTGVTLGFLSLLLFSAIQAAGSLIDLFGGFTISAAYDPFLNAQSSVMGRVYNLLALTLLFATNAHLLLIKGFLTSFDAVPLSASGMHALSRTLVSDIGFFFLSAVEIAGPMLAVLFLADVVLGLLARAAPQMQIFTLGFPFKILLTLLFVGAVLPLLPGAVSALVDHAIRDGTSVLRSVTG